MENGKENKTGYRVEQDSIGAKDIPGDVYYGVQSLRAAENFRITGLNMHPEIINSLAYIKKASAITNCESGILEKKKAKAIVQACDEILTGKLHEYFIVDPIQGGAGTSLNMNANEVIANRAIEILGGKKGDYSAINPNDDVNCGQSTNDVIPTAGKMTSLRLLQNLKKELLRLHGALCKKAEEFDHVIKMGRTQMQDAVPIRLGQEFQAYSDAIMRDIHRMDNAMDEMRTVNMGGTAVGTGINADEAYVSRIVPNLSKISDIQFVQAFDLIDATQNLDPFVAVSGAVKACAVTLSKIANDLRLMSSGPRAGFGEINLPAKQNGSSIMPGKVNPVIPEVVNQVAFNIIGNVVGSNIFNLMVVCGACALFAPLTIKKDTLKKEFPLSIICAALLMVLGYVGMLLGHLDGGVFLLIFAAYLIWMIGSAKKARAAHKESQMMLEEGELVDEEIQILPLWKCALFIVGGMIAIKFGGDFVVDSASALASAFGLSQTLIGLTIVAMGTSLPELVTSIVAARKNEVDMALGNVIGSNIFNILLVLGVAAAISPVKFLTDNIIDTVVLIAMSLVVLVFAWTSKMIDRREGATMLGMYAVYMAYICIR